MHIDKLPFRRALLLAPHTDDIEFGCGGTVSRLLRQGCEMKYVAFSDCQESIPHDFPKDTLAKELIEATSTLGVKNVELLNFKVRFFPRKRQKILETLYQINKDYKPDIVFTPCTMDIHQDHSTISQESIRAFKRCTILGYELPWNNLLLPSDTIVKLNSEDIEKKISAIGKYKSQVFRKYSEPSFIRSLAITRGSRINEQYAEAFEAIRIVW